MNLLDDLCGPIATFECRRAVQPGWLRWLRMFAGVPAAGITILVVWLWILWLDMDPAFQPSELFAGGLYAIEMTQIVLALLLSPALIAGAIASEKDRGTLTLLLASRLTSRDIILGRLAGCYSQELLIAAAALPMIVFFAALRNARLYELLLLIGLPAAVALGAGGVAVAASALARRGRDALLVTYLIEVLLLLASYFVVRWSGVFWLEYLNPFNALTPLVFYGAMKPAAGVAALWLALFAGGTLLAAWQLRPTYRRQTGGPTRKRSLGRRWAPAVSDRPMLWKELFIESGGSQGAISRWLTRLFICSIVAGGVVVYGALAWRRAVGDPDLPFAVMAVGGVLAVSATYVTWLIQWATGMRAAGMVNGERQRSTWDAILVSPLEGPEIIYGKVCGSLYSLRYLALATLFGWSASVAAGIMPISQCAYSMALLVAGCAFMSAVGVAVSMVGASTTRAMATTIGLWMAAAVATTVLAAITSSFVVLGIAFVAAPFAANNGPSLANNYLTLAGSIWFVAYAVARVALYFVAALIVIGWILARFDILAGRMGTLPFSELAKRSLDVITLPFADDKGEKEAAPAESVG